MLWTQLHSRCLEFGLFLLLVLPLGTLSDTFMGQKYVSITPSRQVSRVFCGGLLHLRAGLPLNQTRCISSLPAQTARPCSSGRREGRELQGGYSPVQGRRAPINLPAVCFPSSEGFRPLCRDADGLSPAVFSCLASSASRNPGGRWVT